jgi:hypothetical protein
VLSLISTLHINGCSLHYYDPQTQAEHIFGIGHMVMKVQDAGANRIAVVKGINSLGIAGGTLEDGAYLGAGWSSHHNIQIFEPNTKLDLLWPTSDWLNLRIGESFEKSESTNKKVTSTEK